MDKNIRAGLIKRLSFFLVAIFFCDAVICATAVERHLLWPHGAPLQKDVEDAEVSPATPTLDHYPASRWAAGSAVIICPGGGYGGLALKHEGEEVASWFNERGVVAFVLRYRHAQKYFYPVPMLDVQRAIRHVRSHAAEYGIKSDMIGIMGFSAGGHLASVAATHFDEGNPAVADPIDRVSCRPDFAILCYPVISFVAPFTHEGSHQNFFGDSPSPALAREFSSELQVTAKTPPTFIFHTDEDSGVLAENSTAFYLALRQAKVPAELHIYRTGRHGGGLWLGEPGVGEWPSQLASWLRGIGLLDRPATGSWKKSPSLHEVEK